MENCQHLDMFERMTEPLNSSSLGAMGSLLRKLDELLRTEERAQGLIGDLRDVSTKMLKLSDVHNPPHTVKYWMNDARELSYDMEVCVDLFVHASQPEDLPDKVAWILTWTKKILGFEARVKEVNERCVRYNLVNKYVISNPAKIVGSHHLRTLYKEPNPGSMKEPQNKLLEWLMPRGHGEEDLKLKVVSVLGDEGVGKSTLVKRVWQESLQDKFEFKCWAFVQTAKKPDTRMILRSILSQVHPKQPINASKVPKLIDDLREHLQDKRYFIVIDGLWDVSVWNIIKRAFPAGNQRIVTTTSVEKVAHVCCSYDSNSIINVKCLCGDEAKNLFVDRAFGSEKGCPPQFNDATDEITRKCGGFPLAIICTARIVASQPETEQEQQLDYINRFLPNNMKTHSSSLEILNQVLKLCYGILPHCLKTCLLYLSVYPENYLLLKEDIVKKWIAEDFICTPEGKDIVEVAGSYFDELLSLGLIQRMDIVNSNKKGSLSYTVHPVVFDFITCKSMEDNFITIIDYSQSTVVLTEKVRRLSLHFGSASYATTPEGVELSQVRSLCFIGLLGCLPSIAEFKLVRVMILHICSDDMDTRFSLSEICHLLQLRYLQVRGNVTVDLPDQIQCLKHLETLEINAGVEDVPSDIVHLLRLWHVRLGEKTKRTPRSKKKKRTPSQLSSVDWSGLPCPSISLESFELLHPICIFLRLPQWFIQLRKLRILEIVVRQLSKDIDALAELPVLKNLSLYVRTPPTAAIILSTGMFPALEYFKFECGVLPLGFQKGTLPNLRRLKLVFNGHRGACSYSNMLVGIEHLLSLQKVAGSIGLAHGTEESDRIAAESAFKDAIRKHPCYPSLETVKRVDPVDEDWNQQGEEKSSNERRGQGPKWKLAFQSPPQLSIYTGLKIEDDNGNPLKVILVDPDTGSPSALPSPLSIELVPLLGDFQHHEDWTADEFEKAILREPEGMRPLLTGDIRLTMWNGHATVGELKFTDNSSWVHSLKLRIGARVVPGSYDGGRIIEAITEALRPVQWPSLPAEAAPMVKENLHSMVRVTVASTFRGRLPLWKLAFRNPLKFPIFTGSKIVDEAGNPLEVILVGADIRAPAALLQPLRVELVPVFGDFPPDGREDWSADEFQRNIVKEREGKRPLLTGDVTLTMRDGRVMVGELLFKDNSSWLRCGKFRIGARVKPGSCSNVRIGEAITEAFVVTDHRGELYRKHYPPLLDDSVWRLEKIGKESAVHRKLRRKNIETVQEFLRMLAVKPEELRAILGDDMTDRMWEAATTHAKTYDPGNKVYAYSSAGCTIYVDSVFNLVKVEIGGIECPLQQLNRDQTILVRQLILQAYEKRYNLMELEKRYPPSLGDSVWVLENIDKENMDYKHMFHYNMKRNNIQTVQEFVRMLMVKPDELRAILGDGMTDRMWEETTTHAKTCEPGHKVYAYSSAGSTIYVNSVFNLVKVEIGGIECLLRQLNRDQTILVRQLILQAYEKRYNLMELEKRYPPSLGDSVWVLENIDKENMDYKHMFHYNLKRNNIQTVQEFVRMLMVKPDELRAILGDGMTDRMWEETTTHAKTCEPGHKVYAYSSAGSTIYVNSVFNLVKVEISGTECPLQQLNGDQTMLVRQLILQAYEHPYDLMDIEKRYPPSLGDSEARSTITWSAAT